MGGGGGRCREQPGEGVLENTATEGPLAGPPRQDPRVSSQLCPELTRPLQSRVPRPSQSRWGNQVSAGT